MLHYIIAVLIVMLIIRRITFPSSEAGPSGDRRSGEPASPPSSPLTDIDGPEADPPSPPLPAKRPRRSIRAKPIEQDIAETKLDKGKGKAKAPVKAKKAAMPRKNSTCVMLPFMSR